MGESMGRFGTMHFASRHPDVFGFARSVSGAVFNEETMAVAFKRSLRRHAAGTPSPPWVTCEAVLSEAFHTARTKSQTSAISKWKGL
jgi:enterochelin esterase-like enzyme